MEGPEFLLAVTTIISIFVALPAIIVNGIVRARKAKAGARGGDALHLSELQLLIESAVDEATAPLRARIEALEEEQMLLPPHPVETSEEAPRQPAARVRQPA
jgi:hypothetical protein